ncbi:Cobalamin biosynthesis protein CobD [Tepidimonas alkaliphilus]|uniref:Cobalamin biosynthesis protein CobD n=1 Tax=Tepidimonas alkaliphilus TaxID=2588942 RepID=A0A554WD78_9BURK|nr:adenosylcobinamide-phosphate synthase CbiB [Tepidimonas alkaliphilus]TSE21541.1 Cobalamin biosynthesis protein CobD [Tepidimonas alkaliphilus]
MEQAALAWPPAGALALAVAVALAWDARFGEPPARLHPVVAMGWVLAALGRGVAPLAAAAARPERSFATGALAWTLGAAGVAALAWAVQALLSGLPWWAQGLALGVLLKPLLAWRMLRDEVAAVEAALKQGLEAGRAQVARLVSRDVQALDEAGVRQAALSTLAENLNDSVVAPLFWFALAGLPGAALYRWANTADAMWGYRGVRGGRDWTWAGRWAARADDALSWLPARLSALLLLAASGRGVAWRALRAQARRTPSPNGGWPMGALALRLGVRLVKPGVYALHEDGRLPQPADTARALAWCGRAVVGWGALLVAGMAALEVVGRPS